MPRRGADPHLIHKALHDRKAKAGPLFGVSGGEQRLHRLGNIRNADAPVCPRDLHQPEYDDLYSAGCMGLVKACDAFDPERGVCFSTYAVPVILGEIKKLFRDGGTVKVSRSLKELNLRINAAREHHRKLCGTEPTLSQLAEELGESVENITLAVQAAQPIMSLTPENRDEPDRQIDIPVESPEEALADKIGLAEVLGTLPEEDQRLIRLRFYANRTQSETAKILHTTQVQISRRERKLLKLMRAKLLEE